jgi:hypothetical protein
MFFRPTASAALRELAVYDHGRLALHAIAFGFYGCFRLLHVMDNNLA